MTLRTLVKIFGLCLATQVSFDAVDFDPLAPDSLDSPRRLEVIDGTILRRNKFALLLRVMITAVTNPKIRAGREVPALTASRLLGPMLPIMVRVGTAMLCCVTTVSSRIPWNCSQLEHGR